MNNDLQDKLKTLPLDPGVYFHKDAAGEVIYVGKASVLKNRVRQYFHKSSRQDAKTKALVAEIHDTDWIVTDSELDALFLEAEMVKRYMPRFNILLRDDKSPMYIRIDMLNEWPTVSYTHSPLDDGAEYFGPYFSGFAIKKALRHLRRIFPYFIKPFDTKKPIDLDSHLGLTPSGIGSKEYKATLRQLIGYINGSRTKIVQEITRLMNESARNQQFELAAKYRNQLRNLKELSRKVMFGDKEFLDISSDNALNDLQTILKMPKAPARIEGYDVSHMSGVDVVASMVVFTNGASDRREYRKFKARVDQNNDYFNMNETIGRRLSQKNIKSWGMPDLVLIDGGKGQLEAALEARNRLEASVPFIGLAKKQELIVLPAGYDFDRQAVEALGGRIETSENFYLLDLPNNTDIIKLLQRIRDESHRFAVSYHTVLKRRRQTVGALDMIVGIGPKTRAKLLRHFKSYKGISEARESEIAELIGATKAKIIKQFIS
jgi:excinuclease ABC subunit C